MDYNIRLGVLEFITVNPLLTPAPPSGGLIYFKHIWGGEGGLIETGGIFFGKGGGGVVIT